MSALPPTTPVKLVATLFRSGLRSSNAELEQTIRSDWLKPLDGSNRLSGGATANLRRRSKARYRSPPTDAAKCSGLQMLQYSASASSA
jgi:hypothetical protein